VHAIGDACAILYLRAALAPCCPLANRWPATDGIHGVELKKEDHAVIQGFVPTPIVRNANNSSTKYKLCLRLQMMHAWGSDTMDGNIGCVMPMRTLQVAANKKFLLKEVCR
jgi:hypothetical protein